MTQFISLEAVLFKWKRMVIFNFYDPLHNLRTFAFPLIYFNSSHSFKNKHTSVNLKKYFLHTWKAFYASWTKVDFIKDDIWSFEWGFRKFMVLSWASLEKDQPQINLWLIDIWSLWSVCSMFVVFVLSFSLFILTYIFYVYKMAFYIIVNINDSFINQHEWTLEVYYWLKKKANPGRILFV